MANDRSRFALFIGNRGFFPASLLETARHELVEVLGKLGHEVLALIRPPAPRCGGDAARGRALRPLPPGECGTIRRRSSGAPQLRRRDRRRGRTARRRRADPGPGLSGRDGPHGTGGSPGRLLRQVLRHGCLLPVRGSLHRPEAPHRPPATPRFAENIDHWDRV